VLVHTSAFAQWTQQTIRLLPGWNAVFFEVEPQPRDCDSIFRGIPIESVWAWNQYFSSVQFVQDPNTILPDEPRWLGYFPLISPQADMTNLHIIQGGRPYLIKLRGTQAVNLVVTGQPKIRPIQWLADSYNFVGFHINTSGVPTFASFFASSPAHAGQKVYRLNTAGRWQEVTNPATETMRAGEGYWVFCRGKSQWQGPLQVVFDLGDSLDYERILMERTLRIVNATSANRTITLRQRDSGQPPSTSFPVVAGPVPLSYYENDLPNKKFGWKPLPGQMTLPVPAGTELALRLSVRRPDMAPFTPPAGRDSMYQSLLDVWDGAGSLFVLPVSARGLGAPRVAGFSSILAQQARGVSGAKLNPTPPHPRTGLWVGNVDIKAVSNPTSGSLDPRRPLPVSSPFSYPLIVHVDSSGQARLLQQVIQMWKEGAWIPNPNDPTSHTYILDPNNPGRAVLLTNDALIPQFSGLALRDVKLVGRRISSPAFGFKTPILMNGGDFGTAGNLTSATVVLDYQDPVNPFKHKYHPDHNNLDERFENTIPEGFESYTVTRILGLLFTSTDPDDLPATGWGDELLGGIYSETVIGIHRSPIYAQGTFRLQRVSGVAVLNDGLE
jgi:hypothetical protein